MTYTASSSFPLLVPHSFGFLSPLSRYIVNGSFYSALMLMKVWMTSFWVNKYWSDGPFIAWYHALIKKDNLWQGLMSVSNLNNKRVLLTWPPGQIQSAMVCGLLSLSPVRKLQIEPHTTMKCLNQILMILALSLRDSIVFGPPLNDDFYCGDILA